MSDEHQVARPLLDNESLPPVKTVDLLMPTYCHVPFYYQSALARRALLQKQEIRRGQSKCPKKHDVIVRMLSEGRSRHEIAAEVGTSFRVLNQYVRRNELAGKTKTFVQIAKEKSAEIHELHRQGLPHKTIAQKLGINRWSVCEHLSGRVKRNR